LFDITTELTITSHSYNNRKTYNLLRDATLRKTLLFITLIVLLLRSLTKQTSELTAQTNHVTQMIYM